MIDSSKLILKYNTESIEILFPNNYEELIKIFIDSFKIVESNQEQFYISFIDENDDAVGIYSEEDFKLFQNQLKNNQVKNELKGEIIPFSKFFDTSNIFSNIKDNQNNNNNIIGKSFVESLYTEENTKNKNNNHKDSVQSFLEKEGGEEKKDLKNENEKINMEMEESFKSKFDIQEKKYKKQIDELKLEIKKLNEEKKEKCEEYEKKILEQEKKYKNELELQETNYKTKFDKMNSEIKNLKEEKEIKLIESECGVGEQENNFKSKEKYNSEIINTNFKLELKKDEENQKTILNLKEYEKIMKQIDEKNNEINLIKKKYAKKKELIHKYEKIIKENEE